MQLALIVVAPTRPIDVSAGHDPPAGGAGAVAERTYPDGHDWKSLVGVNPHVHGTPVTVGGFAGSEICVVPPPEQIQCVVVVTGPPIIGETQFVVTLES